MGRVLEVGLEFEVGLGFEIGLEFEAGLVLGGVAFWSGVSLILSCGADYQRVLRLS